MRWTPELEGRLHDLCFEGESNAQIAVALGCHVRDVYAARSRLGITIAKVEAAKRGDAPAEAAQLAERRPPLYITAGFTRMREAVARMSNRSNLSAQDARALKATDRELRSMEARINLIWLR